MKLHLKQVKKQTGMTLIEVLISSVILFVAIGTVSGVHRVLNHYQRLNMADYALLLNQQSFFDYTSYALEQKITSGTYEIGDYQLIWQAKLNNRKPVLKSFDPELGADNGYSNVGHVSLFDISFHLELYPEKKFEITQLVIEP
jgi:hypothetical protein